MKLFKDLFFFLKYPGYQISFSNQLFHLACPPSPVSSLIGLENLKKNDIVFSGIGLLFQKRAVRKYNVIFFILQN